MKQICERGPHYKDGATAPAMIFTIQASGLRNLLCIHADSQNQAAVDKLEGPFVR